jgi:hypothetical protein
MVETKTPASPPPAKRPLLDLDTLVIRPIVRIDEVEYELRAPDELSVLENHRLLALGKRIEAIEALEEATDDDDADYDRLLRTFCRKLLLAPDEILERLTTSQRAAVGLTFSRLWLTASLQAIRAIAKTAEAHRTTSGEETTGESSSPLSSMPLEAAP